MWKKLLKYTGLGLAGFSLVVGASVAGVYYSSTLSGALLNYVVKKVPGLAWDSVDGSLSSGLTINNLRYTSQYYGYTPGVTLQADQPLVTTVPTLVDVKVTQAKVELGLACLFSKTICIESLQADSPIVYLALGSEEKLDKLYPNAYEQVSDLDASFNQEKPDSPSSFDWTIKVGRVEQRNLQLFMGDNLGLAQDAINSKLVTGNYQQTLSSLEQLQQLGQLATVTADTITKVTDKVQQFAEQTQQLIAQGYDVATSIAQVANASHTDSTTKPTSSGNLAPKTTSSNNATTATNATHLGDPNAVQVEDNTISGNQGQDIQVTNGSVVTNRNASGDFILKVASDKYADNVNPTPVLKDSVRADLANSLTYRATLEALDTKLELGQPFWRFTAPTLAVQYDHLSVTNLEYDPTSVALSKLGIGQLLVSLIQDASPARVSDGDFIKATNVVTQAAQQANASVQQEFKDYIQQQSKHFKSFYLPQPITEQLATYFNATQAGNGYAPAYQKLYDLATQAASTTGNPLLTLAPATNLIAPTSALGNAQPATELRDQITESLKFFEQPLATSIFKNGYELPLPLTINSNNLLLNNFNLANYEYNSAKVLANQLQLAQQQAQEQAQQQSASQPAQQSITTPSQEATTANDQATDFVHLQSPYPLLKMYQPLLSLIEGVSFKQDVTLKNLRLTGTLAKDQADLKLTIGNPVATNNPGIPVATTTAQPHTPNPATAAATDKNVTNSTSNSSAIVSANDSLTWSWLAWTLPNDPTVTGATRIGGYNKDLIPMALQVSDLDAQLAVNFNSATKKLDANLRAKVQRLPVSLPIAINTQVDLNGVLDRDLKLQLRNFDPNSDITVSAYVDLAKPYLPLQLNATVAKLSLDDLQVSDSQLQLTAPNGISDMQLYLDNKLTLAGKPYTIDANLGLTPYSVTGDLNVDFEQRQRQQHALSFKLLGEIDESLTLSVATQAKNLDLASLTGNPKLGLVNSDFDLYAVYNSLHDWSLALPIRNFSMPLALTAGKAQPINLSGQLLLDAVAMLELDNLDANFLGNSLNGYAHLTRNLDVDLTAVAHNLTSLVPGLTSQAQAHLQLTQTLAQPQVDFDIKVTDLSYRNGASEVVNLGNLTGVGQVNFREQLTGNLDFEVTDLIAGNFILDQATVAYHNPTGRDGTLDLDLESNQANLSATINDFVVQDLSKISGKLQLNNLELDPAIPMLSIYDPITFSYDTTQSRLSLSPFEVTSEVATLSSVQELVYTPQRLTGAFNLSVGDDLQKLLQPDGKSSNIALLTSNLHANALVDLNPSDPLGASSLIKVNLVGDKLEFFPNANKDFSIHLRGVTVNSSISNNNLQLKLDTKLVGSKSPVSESNGIANTGGVANPTDAKATGEALAPINANINVSQLTGAGNLSGSVNIEKVDLYTVNNFLDDKLIEQGYLSAHTTLGGNLKQPLLYGKVSLRDVNLLSLMLPFTVDKGRLDLELHGNAGTIDGVIPTNSTPITLQGNVSWANNYRISSNLTMATKDLLLKLPQFGEVQLDSNITVDFNDNKANVAGKLNLHDGDLTYNAAPSYTQPQGFIINSQQYYQQQQERLLKNEAMRNNNGIDPNADNAPVNATAVINVTIGPNVHFVGYGANAAVKSDNLRIDYNSKRATSLIMTGSLEIPEGQLEQYGQSLIFEKSFINFSNNGSLIPTLDIKAKRNPALMADSNITVGIKITGQATRPVIEFYSNPTLSQAQQVNYLLTGTASDAGDGEVGVQLLSASLANSLSIIQEIGEQFGIKNLRLSTAKSGVNSQVTLSGSVNLVRPIRVNYAYGLFNGLSDISGTVNLIPGIFLRLSYGLSWAVDAVYSRNW